MEFEKIVEALKQEVMTIKKAHDENPDYSYRGKSSDGEELGINYLVILKDGTYFYIAYDFERLPEFTENDIVYIRKKIRDDDDHEVDCDTIMGEFKCASGTLYYDQLPIAYFKAENEFDTMCYD